MRRCYAESELVSILQRPENPDQGLIAPFKCSIPPSIMQQEAGVV